MQENVSEYTLTRSQREVAIDWAFYFANQAETLRGELKQLTQEREELRETLEDRDEDVRAARKEFLALAVLTSMLTDSLSRVSIPEKARKLADRTRAEAKEHFENLSMLWPDVAKE